MVTTAKGPMEIVELSFFADDPRALVAHAAPCWRRRSSGTAERGSGGPGGPD